MERSQSTGEEYSRELTSEIADALAALRMHDEPENLYGPVRYVLSGDGKLLRPLLCILSGELFGCDRKELMPVALAVEVFHNFTLVHDDIMDNAAQRRGRPTVHERWDTADAVLAGDYLMGMSYGLLAVPASGSLRDRLTIFQEMVVKLCEGQALDKRFEERDDVSVDDYLDMIRRKTGSLIETSMHLGAVMGGAGSAALGHIRSCGGLLGRAFQIQDDLLDLTAADDSWGKPIGGDLIEGKKTYLLLTALEMVDSEHYSWFRRIVEEGGLPSNQVPEARNRMEQLGVLEKTRSVLAELYDASAKEVDALPSGPQADTLRWLIRKMSLRIR